MVNANTKIPAENKKRSYRQAFTGEKPVSVKPTEKEIDKMATDLHQKVGNKPEEKLVKKLPEQKKFLGLEMKSVAAVVSIALFLVISMSGVMIAQRQRMAPEKVAVPTAPKSKPAAAEPVPAPNCTISFYVSSSSPSPSPSVSPSPSPSVSPSPSPSVSPSPSPSVSPSPSPSVSPSPSPSVSPSPSPSVSPSPSPTYSCNSDCSENLQCEGVNSNYICSSSYGNKCRLDSNPSSEDCQTKPDEYACNSDCETNEQCQTASSNYICYQNKCRLDNNPNASNCQNYQDTPATVGCNDTCTGNSDCSNSAHICYNNSCRLATNPDSSTCSSPTSVTQQSAPKGAQPELPAELPASGSDDVINWLKAGLGVLGMGTVLLLLL